MLVNMMVFAKSHEVFQSICTSLRNRSSMVHIEPTPLFAALPEAIDVNALSLVSLHHFVFGMRWDGVATPDRGI